jgi:hypothetical protein
MMKPLMEEIVIRSIVRGMLFMTKLSSDGQLVYSTFIGGSGEEIARAIHLLPNDEVVFGVTGGKMR